MPVKLAIVYSSSTGYTHRLAAARFQGRRTVETAARLAVNRA